LIHTLTRGEKNLGKTRKRLEIFLLVIGEKKNRGHDLSESSKTMTKNVPKKGYRGQKDYGRRDANGRCARIGKITNTGYTPFST